MERLKSLLRFLVKGIRVMEKISMDIVMVTLFGLMILGAADVIGRYIFNSSITGTPEIGKFVLVVITALGLAQTQMDHSHVSVEILYELLPHPVQRILDLICTLASMAFWGVLGWQSVVIGLQYAKAGRRLQTIGLPTAWLQYLAAIGAFLLSFELLFQLFEIFRKKDEVDYVDDTLEKEVEI